MPQRRAATTATALCLRAFDKAGAQGHGPWGSANFKNCAFQPVAKDFFHGKGRTSPLKEHGTIRRQKSEAGEHENKTV